MAGLSSFGFYAAGIIILGFLTSKAHSITCYVCNSEYDPSCGNPFKPYTIGQLNCSLATPPEHVHNSEATLCRKVVQKVQGEVRVIRSCGYIQDPDRDDRMCARRSGTHDVQVDYCSCTTDLCNSTTKLGYSLSNTLIFVIVAFCLGMSVFNINQISTPSFSLL